MTRSFVIAAHGITGSGVSWDRVAHELGDSVDFVAPDLRGRGSRGHDPGPYTFKQMATDLVEELDRRSVDRAVVAGHSMGGFVAVVLAAEFPDRVERLVLVDGGIPLALPEGLSREEILAAVLGPALARLSMTFESREKYHEFWRNHPAIGPYWNEYVERYIDYDLTGAPPAMRSKVSGDAVRGASEDTFDPTVLEESLASLSVPAVLLRAERGLFDETPPLYTDEMVAKYPQVKDLGVVPENHYTILLGETGARTVAETIRSS